MSGSEELSRRLQLLAPVSRRQFLKRSVVMAAAAPAFGTLLSACGGDDDDDDDDDEDEGDAGAATPTTSRVVPTPGIGGQATATEGEEEEPTEAEEEPTEAEEEPTEAEEEPTATEEPEGDGEPVQGGVFVALGHHEIASLSPDDWGPAVHYFIVGNIHSRLLKLDNFYLLQPDLAESFEVTEDGLTYTFTTRSGVTWHDGEAFSAGDVAYTFNYYRNPDNAAASASNYTGVTDVQATDDSTVVVSLEQPNAAFLVRAGLAGIVAEHHHGAIGEDAYKADPVGTGPWMVSEWRAAEFTECVRFEDYWEGPAYMDGIRENIVPEASVRAIALENQEADSAVWPLVTDDHLRFRDGEDFADYTIQITSSVAVNHLPMNNQHPALSDVRVRKAMMYALDREAIRDDLWQGLAVLATANMSPAIEFYYEADVEQYPYDTDQAIALLEEAGWVEGSDGIREKDGQKLAWTCTIITGDQARRPEAELAQANFRDVGMDMTIAEAPVATIQEGQRSGDIDMSLYNWTYGGGNGEPDATNTLRSGERNNWSLYSNARMDELLDAGLVETDPEARREIYSEVQKIVADEVPFLFVKFWDWFNIFTPRVKGLPENPLVAGNQYQFLHQMWLDEES
jgi:peptide/nickel transport system substrate-binding protein